MTNKICNARECKLCASLELKGGVREVTDLEEDGNLSFIEFGEVNTKATDGCADDIGDCQSD